MQRSREIVLRTIAFTPKLLIYIFTEPCGLGFSNKCFVLWRWIHVFPSPSTFWRHLYRHFVIFIETLFTPVPKTQPIEVHWRQPWRSWDSWHLLEVSFRNKVIFSIVLLVLFNAFSAVPSAGCQQSFWSKRSSVLKIKFFQKEMPARTSALLFSARENR